MRADGKVFGWGANGYGQIDCPDENFIAIAAGGFHSLGLRADGKIIDWGWYNNQIDCLDEKFISIDSGFWRSLGLRADGKIFVRGSNRYDQVCPDEKFALPYDFLGRLNRNVKVLCSIPKYIKMEILEDYIGWSFGNLYHL